MLKLETNVDTLQNKTEPKKRSRDENIFTQKSPCFCVSEKSTESDFN